MTPVELQVTNLDQNIDQRDMKKTILNIFREHVTVMSVSVFFQSGKFINHILLDKIFRRIIQYFITFFRWQYGCLCSSAFAPRCSIRHFSITSEENRIQANFDIT